MSPALPRFAILVNQAECAGCGKLIVSRGIHDFRAHKCPVVAGIEFYVDGGNGYIRRMWGHGPPEMHFTERSIEIDRRLFDHCFGGGTYAPV